MLPIGARSRKHRSSTGFRNPVRGFAVALAIVYASACDSPPQKPSHADEASPAAESASAAKPPRIVVLGLDAGTWELLGPWMDKGLLPNLARIRAEGVHGKLRSTEPSSSPVIWTSIATGKTPDKTGIDWFVRFPEGPAKPVPVNRLMRKTKALWNILGERRFDVGVVGWYVTWPAEEVNGRLVSDIAHYGNAPNASFPPDYMWDLKPVPEQQAVAAMPRFMDFAYDPTKAVRSKPDAAGVVAPPSLDFLVYDRFVRAYSRDSFYLAAAHRMLKDGPLPEVFFLYLRGTDDVQHGFWKFMQPEAFKPRPGPDGQPLGGTTEVPPGQVAAFGKVIERYWQWTDEEVGKVLAHYETPPLVIVCSDHGAGPAVGHDRVQVADYMHLSGSHRIDGVVMASGPGIARGREITGATIYDIAPTILHALGLPIAKDMDGRPLTAMFEAAREDDVVESYDTGTAKPSGEQELPAAVDEKVLEHLKSLGYIGE
jgi:predicted AlkP superfamily phosphohydrolase/phosphomutase